MKHLLAVALLVATSAPASAQCHPPPGMSVQQWYSACGGLVERAYSQSGQGMPYNDFVAMIYQQYIAMPRTPPAVPMSQMPPGLQTCRPGAGMCMNGWWRTCQIVGNGTMWITGAQRCSG